MGGLSRDIASSIVQEKFERFGEILEIDIKKIPVNPNSVDPLKSKSCYANVQFTDLNSVCRGIRSSLSMDEQLYRPEKLKSFSTLQFH